jgi:hypothetical protein
MVAAALKALSLFQAVVCVGSRAALWIAVWLGAPAVFFAPECDGDETDDERSVQLLSQMRSLAGQTTVKFAKSQRPIELVKTPVFRYSDQPRQFIDATLWVWTNDGRPVAFQKIEALEFAAEATRPSLWQLCFASVSADFVVAQWPEGRSFQSTEPGLTFRALSESPAVATGNSQRKRQAREIVRKFSARIVTNPTNNTTQEMRLLTTPIFDYDDRSTGEFMGSVFGLSTNGTNPDVLIVLEVQGQNDKLAWHFAPARMTSGGVTLTYRDSKVWETKWLNASEGPFPTWTYFVVPRQPLYEAKDRP